MVLLDHGGRDAREVDILAPPTDLAGVIEHLWVAHRTDRSVAAWRVVPDTSPHLIAMVTACAHERAIREWIRATSDLLRTIERDIISRHERLYGQQWFASPVRVDIVWVGRAYTTLNPMTHTTISPAEGSGLTGWTGVEMVLHEVCHELILPTEDLLAEALGSAVKEHGGLWHVIQFYQTGAALQRILRARGIDYTPYMYSTVCSNGRGASIESPWRSSGGHTFAARSHVPRRSNAWSLPSSLANGSRTPG